MTAIAVRSTSRAEDAGYLALADIATVAGQLDADYRIIGGHMVSLLVALHGVTGVPERSTSDADLAAEFSVVGDPRLIDSLTALGYTRPGASNRFVRPHDGELTAVIDVLTPSYSGRHEPNRQHGEMFVDAIPGLVYALGAPAVVVDLTADLSTDSRVDMTILVPGPLPALWLKLLAWDSRMAAKDAIDIWRLLAVCNSAGITGHDWPDTGTARDARAVLRRFAAIDNPALRQLARDRAIHTRIRALAQRIG